MRMRMETEEPSRQPIYVGFEAYGFKEAGRVLGRKLVTQGGVMVMRVAEVLRPGFMHASQPEAVATEPAVAEPEIKSKEDDLQSRISDLEFQLANATLLINSLQSRLDEFSGQNTKNAQSAEPAMKAMAMDEAETIITPIPPEQLSGPEIVVSPPPRFEWEPGMKTVIERQDGPITDLQKDWEVDQVGDDYIILKRNFGSETLIVDRNSLDQMAFNEEVRRSAEDTQEKSHNPKESVKQKVGGLYVATAASAIAFFYGGKNNKYGEINKKRVAAVVGGLALLGASIYLLTQLGHDSGSGNNHTAVVPPDINILTPTDNPTVTIIEPKPTPIQTQPPNFDGIQGLRFYVEPGHGLTQEIMEYAAQNGKYISSDQAYRIYAQLHEVHESGIINVLDTPKDTYLMSNGDMGISKPGQAVFFPKAENHLRQLLNID